MGKYIVKRILQVIPMLFILSLIVFMMVRLIPGDPVDMMLGMDIPKDTKEYERERLGLNDPLYIQYFRFVGNALHGDLGTSIFSGKPVVEELAKRFPKTLTLAVGGTLFGAAVGVLLGIIAAIHRNKFADNLIMVLSLLTVSTPSFFLALILMLIFCLNLRWLPSIGMDTWQGAVLPIATLGLQAIGSIARTTRSAMLDVIHQDYIRTSRSRGVPERVITYRHAFKNALIPVLTTIGLRFGGLLANILSPIIVQMTFTFATAIISEASLSFLGAGIPSPYPSWGGMLNEARGYVYMGWWMIVFPAIFTALSVLGFNLFGDGLRDLIDPLSGR